MKQILNQILSNVQNISAKNECKLVHIDNALFASLNNILENKIDSLCNQSTGEVC